MGWHNKLLCQQNIMFNCWNWIFCSLKHWYYCIDNVDGCFCINFDLFLASTTLLMSRLQRGTLWAEIEISSRLKISITWFISKIVHYQSQKFESSILQIRWAVLKSYANRSLIILWLHVKHNSFDDFLSHLMVPPICCI